MPNHITNRLIIKASEDRVREVLGFIKGETEYRTPMHMDFNTIISMPEALDISSGIEGELGMKYLLAKQKRFFRTTEEQKSIDSVENMSLDRQDRVIALGKRYLLNLVFFGATTWYDWCIENWGTKWNAYDQRFEAPNTIWFNTAWSGVADLIQKLSKKFPDVEFDYTYADEDTGSNTGTGAIKDGVISMHYPDNQSNEAYDLAFELNPEYRDNYELTEDGYKYKEEKE